MDYKEREWELERLEVLILEWILEIEIVKIVKRYQLLAKAWLRYWLENHKHVRWILNYDNKVPRTAQGKRSVERCLFPLTFPNLSFSIHPNTVSNLSWFIFSPLFNGVSKIEAIKMTWYQGEGRDTTVKEWKTILFPVRSFTFNPTILEDYDAFKKPSLTLYVLERVSKIGPAT